MTRAILLFLLLLPCVVRAQCPCTVVPDSLLGERVEVTLRDVVSAYGDWGYGDDPVEWSEIEAESISLEFGELVAVGPYLVVVDDMFGTATRIPCESVVRVRPSASAPR